MTDNTETLIALRKSIDHWEENASVDRLSQARIHAQDCALCVLYRWSKFCDGCPVFVATGERECLGTPYHAAYHYKCRSLDVSEFRKAAQAELTFLQALWPAGADITEDVG